MAMDENMLGSEMRDQVRRIKSAERRSGRAAAMKAGVEKARAGNSIDLEELLAEEAKQKMPSRSTRRMGSGLLQNAPRPVEPTKSTSTFTTGQRTSRSGGGDFAYKKSEPTPAKTMQNMTTGSRSDIAAKGKAAAIKFGALKPNASMAAKGAGTIAATGAAARAGAMTAAKILGPVAMLAASEKAAGATPSEEMSMMRQSMQNPSGFYNTMGPGSVKNPAYSGQSTMSKLMGVGKKGK